MSECPVCFHDASLHTQLGCCGTSDNFMGCGCMHLVTDAPDMSLLMIAADKIALARLGADVEVIGFDDPSDNVDTWTFRVCRRGAPLGRRKSWQMLVTHQELIKVAMEQQSLDQIQGKAPDKAEADAKAQDDIDNIDDFFSDRL